MSSNTLKSRLHKLKLVFMHRLVAHVPVSLCWECTHVVESYRFLNGITFYWKHNESDQCLPFKTTTHSKMCVPVDARIVALIATLYGRRRFWTKPIAKSFKHAKAHWVCAWPKKRCQQNEQLPRKDSHTMKKAQNCDFECLWAVKEHVVNSQTKQNESPAGEIKGVNEFIHMIADSKQEV